MLSVVDLGGTNIRLAVWELVEKQTQNFLLGDKGYLSARFLGQLTGQFNMNKVWPRKIWTLSGRLSRKILAHSLDMFAITLFKNKPLQLEHVINV